ncbi:hypothetical protein [Streptomyces sp. NPDC054849]
MADDAGPIGATLYDATQYEGTAVTVKPDAWAEGGAPVAYSLASLGLRQLGSLRAPALAAHPDDPFRQELRRVTTITVWETKPDSLRIYDGERGRDRQDYSADTADLGVWAAKAKYVRVWQQAAPDPAGADLLRADRAAFPPVIVE